MSFRDMYIKIEYGNFIITVDLYMNIFTFIICLALMSAKTACLQDTAFSL